MGRLGLELSNKTWLSNPNKPVTEKLSLRDLPIVVEEEVVEDSAVDSVIAYVSYYILVFVAFCAFMPSETAYAVGYTKYTIYHTVTGKIRQSVPAKPPAMDGLELDWDLRQTKP